MCVLLKEVRLRLARNLLNRRPLPLSDVGPLLKSFPQEQPGLCLLVPSDLRELCQNLHSLCPRLLSNQPARLGEDKPQSQ